MPDQNMPPPIPAHVPRALVFDYALERGTTTGNGFDDIVDGVHASRPPVFYAPNGHMGMYPAWVLLRAEDIRKVYLDTAHFSSNGMTPFATLLGESWEMIPLDLDPPRHGIFRAMANGPFTAKSIQQLGGKVRGYAQKYLSRFEHEGECEFMAQFAFEYPITVVLELMNLPQEMVGQFLAWEHLLLHEIDPAKITVAARAVAEYLRGVLRERRQNPGADILSYAAHSLIDGRAITDDELLGFAYTLYTGGLDTVTTTLGNMFRHLAEHPDLQARLRADPSLIPAAVEELLRAHSPATTSRQCIADTEIRGVTIKAGDRVMVSTALGSRDPAEFAAPADIVLGRKENHLGFGYGVHRCLGVHLARMELVIAFEEILGRLPQFRIKPGAVIKTYLPNVIQIDQLPLVWERA